MARSDWFEGFETRTVPLGDVALHVRLGGRLDAPPLLLLHGYPQTGALWHRVARALAADFRLVIPDLRGYGRSTKPDDGGQGAAQHHALMSKRAMAADVAALMAALGHDRFCVAGHDRGGRVAHRLALDHRDRVAAVCVLDIAPTLDMYEATDMRFASAYFHWFHLIQPAPLPERMIGGDPSFYLRWTISGRGRPEGLAIFEPEALAEYEETFSHADTIHATCEDYRAAATIDLEHDRASRAAGDRIGCDLLVLWGERGVVGAQFDPIALWRAQCAGTVAGEATPSGHYVPEECPALVAERLRAFCSAHA